MEGGGEVDGEREGFRMKLFLNLLVLFLVHSNYNKIVPYSSLLPRPGPCLQALPWLLKPLLYPFTLKMTASFLFYMLKNQHLVSSSNLSYTFEMKSFRLFKTYRLCHFHTPQPLYSCYQWALSPSKVSPNLAIPYSPLLSSLVLHPIISHSISLDISARMFVSLQCILYITDKGIKDSDSSPKSWQSSSSAGESVVTFALQASSLPSSCWSLPSHHSGLCSALREMMITSFVLCLLIYLPDSLLRQTLHLNLCSSFSFLLGHHFIRKTFPVL